MKNINIKNTEAKEFIKESVRTIVELIGVNFFVVLIYNLTKIMIVKKIGSNPLDTLICAVTALFLYELYKKHLRPNN